MHGHFYRTSTNKALCYKLLHGVLQELCHHERQHIAVINKKYGDIQLQLGWIILSGNLCRLLPCCQCAYESCGKTRQSVGLWLIKKEPLKHPFQITASDLKVFKVPRMVVLRGCHTQKSRTLRVRGNDSFFFGGSPNWEHTEHTCGQGVAASFSVQLPQSYVHSLFSFVAINRQAPNEVPVRPKWRQVSHEKNQHVPFHCTGCLGFPWAIVAINDT